MTSKDLKIQRLFHLSGIALSMIAIGGGMYAYRQYKSSDTARAIERNLPKMLDQAGAVDSVSIERAGAAGSFVGELFRK